MRAFGQSSSLFGTSSPFESTTTAFGGQNSAFGSQTPTPAFGSRVASYSATTEINSDTTPPSKFESVSAMPVYKDKSHEELRWEDYLLGDKGSSTFGQKPAFGGFGSTTTPSPFGSATQPSQPAFESNTQQSQLAFGSSIFGSSTPSGASSQPAFGSTGTPAFGATSTPAFGATSTLAFCVTSTPAFGSTSTPAFGNTGGAFGMSCTPVFGGGGAFGDSSSPVFGSSSTSAFGASSSPAFGASSSPAFSFGSSTQAFGQSSSAFGYGSPFGSTTSAFGGQSSAFGSQTPTPAFGNTGMGQSKFGGQRDGSRVASYSATTEIDSDIIPPRKLESVSAMPVYKDKSHEELRWEDYQLGDKGGPLAFASQSTGMAGFNSSTTQTNAFSPFGQSPANPFSSTTPNSNPSSPPKISTFSSGFGTSAPAFSSSAFGSSISAATPSNFGSSTSPFDAKSTSQAFGSSASMFNTAAQSTSSPFVSSIFGHPQPSQLFSSASPSNSQSSSVYGQDTSPSSGLVGSIFSSSASLTSNANTGFGQTAPSMSTPLQSPQPAQSSGTFSFNNLGQTQPVCASSFIGTRGTFGQNNFEFQAIPQSSTVVQAAPVTNSSGTTPSLQCGKSSMPVQDKPASLQRKKIQIRKYKNRGSKPGFEGPQGGSRVAGYSATTEENSDTCAQAAKLVSISAMSVYKNKSHEELRWEDDPLEVKVLKVEKDEKPITLKI